MFLTSHQLRELTGYQRPSAQARWLRAHGIEPFVSATGALQVAAGVVEEVQRRRSGLELQAVRRGPRPNLRAVS